MSIKQFVNPPATAEELAKQADGIGWGYGDYVVDVVGEIAADNEDEG